MNGNFVGELVTDIERLPEGLRTKHRLNRNSLKMYDKQGSVLRIETTINDARDIKVHLRQEGDSTGPRSWRRMRNGEIDARPAKQGNVCNKDETRMKMGERAPRRWHGEDNRKQL